jgi:hypothetical protein
MKIDEQSKAQRGDEPVKEKPDAKKPKGEAFEAVLKRRKGRKGRQTSGRSAQTCRTKRGRQEAARTGRREVMDRLDDRCGVRRRRDRRESGRLERRCHERSVEDGRQVERRHEARSTGAKSNRVWKRADAPTRPAETPTRRGARGRRRGEESAPGIERTAVDARNERSVRVGASRAEGASRTSADVETIRRLAAEVAKSVKVGVDRAKRQVVLMDVEVPGRGTVHVRLRRQGERFDVRLRADDHGLARMLRRHRDDLRQAGDDAGVSFGELRVVDPHG